MRGRFVEMVAAVESARVIDLMRFVYRRLDEGQGLADVPFAVAWYTLLEEYAMRPSDEENAE